MAWIDPRKDGEKFYRGIPEDPPHVRDHLWALAFDKESSIAAKHAATVKRQEYDMHVFGAAGNIVKMKCATQAPPTEEQRRHIERREYRAKKLKRAMKRVVRKETMTIRDDLKKLGKLREEENEALEAVSQELSRLVQARSK